MRRIRPASCERITHRFFTVGCFSVFCAALLVLFSFFAPSKAVKANAAVVSDNLVDRLLNHEVCEVYMDQAIHAGELSLANFFFPTSCATPVVVVDRDKTDADIDCIADLVEKETPFCLLSSDESLRYLLYSLKCGFDMRESSDFKFYIFLRKLSNQDIFVNERSDASAYICLDSEVMNLFSQNDNIEISYPSKNNVSYVKGFLSDNPDAIPPLSPNIVVPSGSSLLTDFTDFANSTERYRRNLGHFVFADNLFSSVDAIEHIFFPLITMVMFILWLLVSTKRIINSNIKSIIVGIGVQVIIWLFLRQIKYLTPDLSIINRYLWYSYYIFLLGIPCMLLWLSVVIDNVNIDRKEDRRLRLIISLCYIILLSLVFTNDFHMLVFRFNPSGNWAKDYTYGIVYFLISGLSLSFVISSLVILIRKAFSGLKRRAGFAGIVIIVLLVIYVVGYARGIPFFRDSDFSLIYISFLFLYLEVCMLTGMIPRNSRYGTLFSYSPLRLSIVDRYNEVVTGSMSAGKPDDRIFRKLNENDGVYLDKSSNIMYYSAKIHGGYVMWQDDVNEIARMNSKINQINRLLESSNKMLMRERGKLAEKAAFDTKVMITDKLEKEIQEKYELLISMIKALPEKEDKKLEVGRITLLLVYIKRRCNFFFREMETENLPADELCVYIDELAEFARYTGVLMLTGCSLKNELKVKHAIFIYDFLYTVLYISSLEGEYNIVEQLIPNKDGLALKLLMNSFSYDPNEFDPGLIQRIEENGGRIELKQLDDTIGISLYFD